MSTLSTINVKHPTSASNNITLDNAGSVGIGTTTPIRRLTLAQAGTPEFVIQDTSQGTDLKNWRIFNAGQTLQFGTLNDAGTAGTNALVLDRNFNLQFNSGYGSVAVAYGCRAWVNFNGTGVVAIRASGNVTAITDNGTGDYTVNFTTAMPDTNYSTVFGGAITWNQTNADQGWANLRSNNGGTSPQQTGSVRIWSSSKASSLGVAVDNEQINVAVFR